jgi:hypothetical protein
MAEALNTTPQALLPDQDKAFWKTGSPIPPNEFAAKLRDTVELSFQCSERWDRLLNAAQHIPELHSPTTEVTSPTPIEVAPPLPTEVVPEAPASPRAKRPRVPKGNLTAPRPSE